VFSRIGIEGGWDVSRVEETYGTTQRQIAASMNPGST
jgi:hypothetical protein